MKHLVRRVLSIDDLVASRTDADAEWLVSNGFGGDASGTVLGKVTRRYHGLLIAALPAPLGRLVMVSGLIEEIRLPEGEVLELSPEREPDRDPSAPDLLKEFRLDMGLPV